MSILFILLIFLIIVIFATMQIQDLEDRFDDVHGEGSFKEYINDNDQGDIW